MKTFTHLITDYNTIGRTNLQNWRKIDSSLKSRRLQYSLSVMNWTTRKTDKQGNKDLNNAIQQLDVKDIYRT